MATSTSQRVVELRGHRYEEEHSSSAYVEQQEEEQERVYYSGETTTRDYRTTTTTSSRSAEMSSKVYGKDLKEYDDVDIETLLAKLSPDELEQLNNDVDPDNSLLPPSQRCREQTDKGPTGPFRREQLLKFLEEKAKKEKDWDEKVPFERGVKRGTVFQEAPINRTYSEDEEAAIELDVDEEFEMALSAAGENDLVDLAGILGMHSMLSQAQYYNALKGKPQDDETGRTFAGVVKSMAMSKLVPDEPPNATDVDECIERLTSDDAQLDVVNVNNMKRVPKEKLVQLIDAAKHSTHLNSFCMANTAITDAEARGLIDVIESSKSLTILNVESNFLSPDLLARLLKATLATQSLIEFHAENQRATVLGNRVEMDMMQSIEDNDTLLRVGLGFQSMEARHRVSEALERNYERLRLKRIEG